MNSKGRTIFFVLLVTVIFGILIVSSFNSEEFGVCFLPLIIVYLVMVYGIINSYEKEEKEKEAAIRNERARNNLRSYTLKYHEIRRVTKIPDNAKEIYYYKASKNSPIRMGTNSKHSVFVWKSEDNICFFPSNPDDMDKISINDVKVYTIPIKQIEYFSNRGEVYRENKISGGGGGGSSIGGAIAGGVIAGGAGAIVGSRKNVNEIKSELITHDTRETFLNYFDGKKERHSLFFKVSAHSVFNNLIPEKEFNIVSALNSTRIIQTQRMLHNTDSITVQLRGLAKLKDEGIITEQEFNEKKKLLLDKIT